MKAGRIFIIAIAVIMTLLLAPGSLWPWGRLGHRASARLAESRLTPAAAAAIRILLEPGESLADASTWADEQREVPRSGPWHYVNVPISEPRYDPKFCPRGGCVVSKIEDFERVLRDPRTSRAEKRQALKFLCHRNASRRGQFPHSDEITRPHFSGHDDALCRNGVG